MVAATAAGPPEAHVLVQKHVCVMPAQKLFEPTCAVTADCFGEAVILCLLGAHKETYGSDSQQKQACLQLCARAQTGELQLSLPWLLFQIVIFVVASLFSLKPDCTKL